MSNDYELLEDDDQFGEPEEEGCCNGYCEGGGGAYGYETCYSCGEQFCGQTCGQPMVREEDADEDWDDEEYREQFCGTCAMDYHGSWLSRGRYS